MSPASREEKKKHQQQEDKTTKNNAEEQLRTANNNRSPVEQQQQQQQKRTGSKDLTGATITTKTKQQLNNGANMNSADLEDKTTNTNATSGSRSNSSSSASSTAVNFMSKFRDKETRVLKNLNSSQFIEVWNNYDKDGELIVLEKSSSKTE